MSLTLDEFIEEEKERLIRFRKYWIANNKKNPEYFPMKMENGNEGCWFEMLDDFDDYDGLRD